jgi:hypothetical protein
MVLQEKLPVRRTWNWNRWVFSLNDGIWIFRVIFRRDLFLMVLRILLDFQEKCRMGFILILNTIYLPLIKDTNQKTFKNIEVTPASQSNSYDITRITRYNLI